MICFGVRMGESKKKRPQGQGRLRNLGSWEQRFGLADAEGFLGGRDDNCKTGCIIDRHLGELLSIQFDVGFDQSIDELAVANSVHPRCCVDTNDPQSSKITTLSSTISIRKSACTDQVLLGRPIKSSTPADVSFGALEHSAFRLTASRTLSRTHVMATLIVAGASQVSAVRLNRKAGPSMSARRTR
jgi:hypothetical protein